MRVTQNRAPVFEMPNDAAQLAAAQAVARATGIDLTALLTALHAVGALIIPVPGVVP